MTAFQITRCDIGTLLAERAAEYGDKMFVTCTGYPPEAALDVSRTFREFDGRVNAVARGLMELGVSRGDFVAIMLPNRMEFLEMSFAIKRLGAVEVAIPPGYGGAALSRMLGLTTPSVLVTDSTLVSATLDVHGETPHLQTIVITDFASGEFASKPDNVYLHSYGDVVSDDTSELRIAPPHPTSLASVLFTSGSTGPSKGVMNSHRFLLAGANILTSLLDLTSKDISYNLYPVYNAHGTCEVLAALVNGGSIVLSPRFSASRLWEEIRRHRATVFCMQGSVSKILWDRPPGPHERDHQLRVVYAVPLTGDPVAFQDRFGCPVLHKDLYGNSESGILLRAPPGTDGRDRILHDVRIVDDFDEELPNGEVGEIVVRSRVPFTMYSGYFNDPEATVSKSRNLWYHTGDLGRLEPDGTLTFVGRAVEKIRSRGKNVSAVEIETAIMSLHGVSECAVVGVQNRTGEDDIVAFVTRLPGQIVTEDEVRAVAMRNLPKVMWPDRVRFIETMPMTDTGKIAKYRLREAGQ